jgi:excisionase family DNA binding protein
LRDLTEWHKKVEQDARAAQRAVESARRAQLDEKPAAASVRTAVTRPAPDLPDKLDRPERSDRPDRPERSERPTSPAVLTRRGRGPRKEESREELLARLLDPTLTLEETAKMLEVCPTTVRRYTNRGILPHDRSKGNQRRFKLSSVLAFMETQNKLGRRETEEL